MRLIDADALIPMMKYATTDSEIGIFPIRIGFESIVKVIESAPTIDAVEVVRCRDCKFSKDTGDYQDTYQCTSRTHAQDYLVHSLDFCSYGVRKDEPQTEPNLILPERMERGEMYEVGDSIVVMNSEDYYDLLCKSWEKDDPQTEREDE